MEISFLLFLQELRESAPDAVNTFFQQYSSIFANALLILLLAVIYWCVNKRAGKLMLFSFACGQLINQSLKNIFCIYRPWILDSRIHVDALSLSEATGYSFPSGHTVNATTFLGSLAIWLRKHVWAVVLCVVAILLVAFSRMWLGCHMPKDVIVALCVSVAALALVCFAMRKLEEHPNWDIPIAGVLVVVSAVALAYFATKGYPVDYDSAGNVLVDPEKMKTDCFKVYSMTIGLAFGWIIERRCINFKMDIATGERVARGVFGVFLVLVLYVGILPVATSVIPDSNWAGFVKYFFLVFSIVALAPAFFGLIHRVFERKQ